MVMVAETSTSFWNRFVAAGRTMFGYDATDSRGRRRGPETRVKHEDDIATERVRKILSATTADLARNFSVARWAIGKHLDYVSAFRFQATTPDRGYNREIEQIIKDISRRTNFDVARRHSLRRAVRITEAHRVKDGDKFWLKLAPEIGPRRGRVQLIEGDKIRTPSKHEVNRNGFDADDWVNGIRLSPGGAATEYAVANRDKSGNYRFDRFVPSRNMLHLGFWDRTDQVRGISPIASALNEFRDIQESTEYAKAKMKVAQLFGLSIYREGEYPIGGLGTADPTDDADDDGTDDSKYEVDFGRGPYTLDMDPGDRAEILESRTPAQETVDFLKLLIHIALRSLNIPYSFFDESFTNFYGSRGGLIQYLKSCENVREDLQEFLDEWTIWRLGLLVVDGILPLPARQEFSFLRWEWVPDGVPWWDKSKEVRGCKDAIAGALDNPQRICRETNTDFFDNVDKIAEAMAYAEERGVPLSYATTAADQPDFEVITQ